MVTHFTFNGVAMTSGTTFSSMTSIKDNVPKQPESTFSFHLDHKWCSPWYSKEYGYYTPERCIDIMANVDGYRYRDFIGGNALQKHRRTIALLVIGGLIEHFGAQQYRIGDPVSFMYIGYTGKDNRPTTAAMGDFLV